VDACVIDRDLERAVGAFVEIRTFGFVIVMRLVGIGEAHLARTQNLESIAEIGSRSQMLGAEAGARIIDFKQKDGLASAIADSGLNVSGMASSDGEQTSEECKDAKGTHGSRVTGATVRRRWPENVQEYEP